jgi:hypothetical protein
VQNTVRVWAHMYILTGRLGSGWGGGVYSSVNGSLVRKIPVSDLVQEQEIFLFIFCFGSIFVSNGN